jgi:hypothetical protein
MRWRLKKNAWARALEADRVKPGFESFIDTLSPTKPFTPGKISLSFGMILRREE